MPNDNAAALDLLTAAGYALAGLVLGALVSIALSVIMRLVVQRHPAAVYVSRRVKPRQRLLLLLLGFGFGIDYASAPSVVGGTVHWRGTFEHAFLIAAILALGNFLVGLLRAFEDGVVERAKNTPDSPNARRVETQMQVVSRVGVGRHLVDRDRRVPCTRSSRSGCSEHRSSPPPASCHGRRPCRPVVVVEPVRRAATRVHRRHPGR